MNISKLFKTIIDNWFKKEPYVRWQISRDDDYLYLTDCRMLVRLPRKYDIFGNLENTYKSDRYNHMGATGWMKVVPPMDDTQKKFRPTDEIRKMPDKDVVILESAAGVRVGIDRKYFDLCDRKNSVFYSATDGLNYANGAVSIYVDNEFTALIMPVIL